MIRALIVEDEPPARRYLAELLHATREAEVVASVGTVAEASSAVEAELGLDAIFVDIRLVDRPGDRSGLEWAQRVARRPGAPQLVLATALPDHALAAFEAGVVDYLLKPFTRARVAACVERLRARRPAAADPTPPRRLVARTATSLVFLSLEGVLAFEAADRLVYVHHDDGSFLVDLSLAALEAQFAASAIRTHRNWIVVLDRVRELGRGTGELVLQVGAQLSVPVSRDRAGTVREALVGRAVGRR